MAGCKVRCMKYILFVFNFIIWLGGAGLIALGVILNLGLQSWIPVEDVATLLEQDDELLEYGSYITIGAGALVFLIAFCGCCGAIKENKCLLGIYFLFLLIVFCAQITAAIFAVIYRQEVEDKIEEEMLNSFMKAYGNKSDSDLITDAWKLAEASLDCCGFEDGKDYDESGTFSQYKHSEKRFDDFPDFPESCCVGASYSVYEATDKDGCQKSWKDNTTRAVDTSTYHGTGCKTKVADLIDEYTYYIIGAGLGLALFELHCLIFALCICRNVDKD